MPVIGAIPIVMPTLTKIWKSSATTMPPAAVADERSRATVTHAQGLARDEEIEREQDRSADEATLLAERREHEVGVVLGQEVQPRLRRIFGPPPGTAGADGGDRLLEVVPRVERAVGGCVNRSNAASGTLQEVDAGRRRPPR